jgi:hypothetical protein
MITLETVLDEAMQLPLEQQRTLIDILWHRYIDMEREKIALEAKQNLLSFHQGHYIAQTAEEVIRELNTLVD